MIQRQLPWVQPEEQPHGGGGGGGGGGENMGLLFNTGGSVCDGC